MDDATGPTIIPVPEERDPMALQNTVTPPPPDIISLDDLLSDIQVLTAKEQTDRTSIEAIGNLTTFSLRPRLVEWALNNFNSLFEIYSVGIDIPNVCVDGVKRDLREYIPYLTGKTLDEYIEILNPKFVGMTVTYGYFGNTIKLFLTKD